MDRSRRCLVGRLLIAAGLLGRGGAITQDAGNETSPPATPSGPDEGDAAWCFKRGASALAEGDCYRAIDGFSAALRADPHLARAYFGRADAHYRRGEDAESLADIGQAIQNDPWSGPQRIFRALLLAKIGDRAGAGAEFDHAGEVGVDPAHLALGRALAALSLDGPAAMSRELDAVVGRFPDSVTARVARGALLARSGDPDRALIDLDRAVTLRPDDTSALLVRADILNSLRKFDRAFEDVDQAIRAFPRSAFAHYVRAEALGGKGLNSRAITDCTKALELLPAPAHVLALPRTAPTGFAVGPTSDISCFSFFASPGPIYYLRACLYFRNKDPRLASPWPTPSGPSSTSATHRAGSLWPTHSKARSIANSRIMTPRGQTPGRRLKPRRMIKIEPRPETFFGGSVRFDDEIAPPSGPGTPHEWSPMEHDSFSQSGLKC